MVGKIAGLARALAIILAIVTGFVAIQGLNVALVLVVLGLVAGLAYSDENVTRLVLTLLVLPAVGAALGYIPEIGPRLTAMTASVGLAAAGAVATTIAIRLFNLVKGDLLGLGAK